MEKNNVDKEIKNQDTSNSNKKQEINLQFHWYALGFSTIYLGSWLIPGFIMWIYLQYLYVPFFLNIKNIIIIFTSLEGLIASISFPFIIMVCYLIHLFFVGLITKAWWNITKKISPVRDGIIPRNTPSKTLNIYHVRSFLIKYPKHAFNRGPFPWLITWLYNFVGTNKIGKGTVIEEQFGADKGVEIGENSYIGVNSGFSSHAVDGIFGNVAYFKIKVGDNVTTSALNCAGPGVEINDNSYLLPIAGATKNNVLKGDNYYFGAPLRKAFSRKVKKYLDITDEDLERAENLKKKRQNGEENE
ncbi:MAG: hypothetical protein EU541_03715 [Promethearchaeota archaeon]|nr:MAG: hypothetical protein EU541_03715 [Candidatus Lokiarchaeota archaeon]